MRLYKLIGLEILQLEKEYKETLAKIAEYEKILSSRKNMDAVIKKKTCTISKPNMRLQEELLLRMAGKQFMRRCSCRIRGHLCHGPFWLL